METLTAWLLSYLKRSFRKKFKSVKQLEFESEIKGFKPLKFSDMRMNEFETINNPQILLMQ